MYLYVEPIRLTSKWTSVIAEVQIAARDVEADTGNIVPTRILDMIGKAVREVFATLPDTSKPAQVCQAIYAAAATCLELSPCLALHAVQIRYPASDARAAYYGPQDVVTVLAGEVVMNPTQKSESAASSSPTESK